MFKDIEKYINEMSLEEKIGQMLHIAVLEDEYGWPSSDMKKAIKELKPGAVRIYDFWGEKNTPFFKVHYTNRLQKWALNNKHQIPLLISSDSEYGINDIVNEANYYPFLRGRSATKSTKLAYNISAAISREADGIGLNMLHQPTADVNTNPENPVIGVRSAGETSNQVVKYVKAQMEGQKSENIITVAKHFPGHGDTNLDSHFDLPAVDFDKKTLNKVHLKPFKELIKAGIDGIMTSHVIVKCLDSKYPATLSKKIINDLLRENLKFNGFIMTDAMTMKAIANNYGIGEAAVKSVKAGVDLVLASGKFKFQKQIRDAIKEAVMSNEISEDRINQSVRRLLKVKKNYNLWSRTNRNPLDILEIIANNYKISVKSYEKSFLVSGNKNISPISSNDVILITGVKQNINLNKMFKNEYNKIINFTIKSALEENNWSPDKDDREYVIDLLEKVDKVIFTSFSNTKLPDNQIDLINKIAKKKPIYIINLGASYGQERISDKAFILDTFIQNKWGSPDKIPEPAIKGIEKTIKKYSNFTKEQKTY